LHWFDNRVHELRLLARKCQQTGQAKETGLKQNTTSSRRMLRLTAEQLAEEVSAHDGVSACLVSYEGLPLAASGHASHLEAMAALSQTCFQVAYRGEESLGLGHPEQIVLVGEHKKLAMISVGELTFCILSPKTSILAEILSRPAEAEAPDHP